MIDRLARLPIALVLALVLAGCARPDPGLAPALAPLLPVDQPAARPSPTLAPTGTPGADPPAQPEKPVGQAEAEPTATPPAAPTRDLTLPAGVDACGVYLPLLSPPLVPRRNVLAQRTMPENVPEAARPALQQLLAHPADAGLAAFRLGEEHLGAYLNQDTPLPLASVVKLVHLVAYVEAVAAGELNPATPVLLHDLERYHLPRTDLGAFRRSLASLEADGRLPADADRLRLEDLPTMMIRDSDNVATDYLHALLGQAWIEATAIELGLASQTAPCPFLGQFLVMSNHARPEGDATAVQRYVDDPAAYGRDVIAYTQLYASNPDFRLAEQEWRAGRRGPSLATQTLFSEKLNAQASAGDYARLMARLAQNGLSDPEASYQARRYLEWPMRFPENQAIFSNLGYKNGSLPGILTTVYYAYRWSDNAPVVVALFYRNLPLSTYQEWRQTLPHDELARWLLADPAAIPTLRQLLD